jgi:hypothetical protein
VYVCMCVCVCVCLLSKDAWLPGQIRDGSDDDARMCAQGGANWNAKQREEEERRQKEVCLSRVGVCGCIWAYLAWAIAVSHTWLDYDLDQRSQRVRHSR